MNNKKEYEYEYKLIDNTWISQKELDKLPDIRVSTCVTEVRRKPVYKLFGEMSAAEQMKLIAAYQTGHTIECAFDPDHSWSIKDHSWSINFSGGYYYRVKP